MILSSKINDDLRNDFTSITIRNASGPKIKLFLTSWPPTIREFMLEYQAEALTDKDHDMRNEGSFSKVFNRC